MLSPGSDSLDYSEDVRRGIFRFPRYTYVTDAGDTVRYYENRFTSAGTEGLGYARQRSYELRFNRMWRGGVEYSFGLQYRREESGWDAGNPSRDEEISEGYSVIDQVVTGAGVTGTIGYVFRRDRRLRPYAVLQARMTGERVRASRFHYVLPQYGTTVVIPVANVETSQVIFDLELEPLVGLTYDLSETLAVGLETRLLPPVGDEIGYVGVQARYRMGE